jgi:hypothetical protein
MTQTDRDTPVTALREALQRIIDLPTVVPDHGHGGVLPPYLEWHRVAEIARAALASSDDVADPMLGTPADGRHPDHACGQKPCPHIPASSDDVAGSGERPHPTLDDFRRMSPTQVNEFLASIGSDWRVATPTDEAPPKDAPE